MRWLLLVLPVVGLLELGLHLYFRGRAPDASDWTATRGVVDRLRKPGDLIVVAPGWAEPLARAALGDERMPLADVARVDESSYAGIVELSALGARAPGLDGFRETARAEGGAFVARRLEPLRREDPLWRALDHVAPATLSVELLGREGAEPAACRYDASAPVSAGGLGGHVTFPSARFRCEGDGSVFAGITLLDDPEYRPRRCVYAKPPRVGALRLTFSGVPLGARLVGYAGSSYLLAREADTEVELRVTIDDTPLGTIESRDALGFRRFELSSSAFSGGVHSLRVEVRASLRRDLDFCFVLESR